MGSVFIAKINADEIIKRWNDTKEEKRARKQKPKSRA